MHYSPDELKVMRAMYDRHEITRRYASSHLNIEHLGARIYDLRQKGVKITTTPVPPVKKGDKRHFVYSLDPEWLKANERP